MPKDETGRVITVKHAFKVGNAGSTVTQRGFATSDVVDEKVNGGSGTTGDSDTAVTEPKSVIKLTSFTSPKTLKLGRPFTVRGKVTSNYKLRKVTVGVYTKSGTKKLEASKKLTVKSFRLKRLDSKLRFGKLKKGTYYYKVVATDEKQTVTLLNKKFRVK